MYLCVLLFQYEEAVDAELTWVGETERKLASLGPLSLEPDVTVAQLQVQRAFNIDIIRHKDTMDQLLKTREDILESCSEQQREALKVRKKIKKSKREKERRVRISYVIIPLRKVRSGKLNWCDSCIFWRRFDLQACFFQSLKINLVDPIKPLSASSCRWRRTL